MPQLLFPHLMTPYQHLTFQGVPSQKQNGLLVLVLDVIFKIASLRVNAVREQRVEFLTFSTLQCRILQRLLESKALILLKSQLEHWEDCSEMEKQIYARTAKEACQLLCHVIAPRDGEKLFQVVQQQQNGGIGWDTGLEALIAAYKKAPSKSLAFMLTGLQQQN